MLISHRFGYIFVKTRKTAGTSIEFALSRHAGPRDVITPVLAEDEQRRLEIGGTPPQNFTIPRSRWHTRDWARWVLTRTVPTYFNHMSARVARRYTGEWDGYFTFTVERNPWDRMVSAFCFADYRGRRYGTLREFLHSEEVERFDNWPLYTIDDTVVVDRVIRYDRLAEELTEVSEKLGLPELELPRAKSGHRPSGPYQEWYDDYTRQRVAELFHREIDRFGWLFD